MDIFFHVYLKNDFSHILLSKFKKFKASGLYDNANKIYLTLFGDIERHQEFLSDLKDLYSKIEYAVIVNQEFNNEADTLNFMLKKAEAYDTNTPMLYLHSKGVSHNNLAIRKNIDAWVRYLDLYTIYQWEECVNSLNDHDISGPFYTGGDGLGQHFQGNFWWANSDYIKKLPRLNKNNIGQYSRGEFWAPSETNKVYAVSPVSPVDLYQTYYCNESDFPNGW
jgi:hypothetical protein